MEEIQSVGIREFRANLHKYTRQSEPVAITSHGEAIGYYIPASQGATKQELANLLEAVGKISHILKESGVSQEDLMADFHSLRRNESH